MPACFYPPGTADSTRNGKELEGKVRALLGFRRGVAGSQGLGNLGGQIVLPLLQSFSYFVSNEPSDGDVLADLGNFFVDQLLNPLLVVLDPELIEQALVLVELLQLAGDDLLPNRLWFFLLAQLKPLNLLFLIQKTGGYLIPEHVSGVARGDLHRD